MVGDLVITNDANSFLATDSSGFVVLTGVVVPPVPQGAPVQLFTSWAQDGLVAAGTPPVNPTVFTVTNGWYITYFDGYVYNNGGGILPSSVNGMIGIKNTSTNEFVVPMTPAKRLRHITVWDLDFPSPVYLPPGNYQVLLTPTQHWSNSGGSNYRGMSAIEGLAIT